MVYRTSTGKVLTSITIKPEVRDELRKRGIPLGSACELWLNNVDRMQTQNQSIKDMEANIDRMQKIMRSQSQKIAELQDSNEVKQ